MSLPTETHRTVKKVPEISVFGTLLCLLVIFIHAASPVVSAHGDGAASAAVAALWRLAGFAVQGFIFLAGLRFSLNHPSDNAGFRPGKYILKRFLRILPAYIVWSVLYYFYGLYIEKGRFSLAGLLKGMISGGHESHLYFVPVILQFALLAPLVRLIAAKIDRVYLIGASLLISIIFGPYLTDLVAAVFPSTGGFAWSDRVFPTYLVYYVAGCAAGEDYDGFVSGLRRHRTALWCVYIAASALELAAVYYSYVKNRFVWSIEQIHMLYCLVAILFFFMLSSSVGKEGKTAALCLKTDSAGYTVYLAHKLVMNAAVLLIGTQNVFSAAGIRLLCGLLTLIVCTAAVSGIKKIRAARMRKS